MPADRLEVVVHRIACSAPSLEETMQPPDQPADKSALLRSIQIIAGAMIVGVLAGAGVTLLILGGESMFETTGVVASLAGALSLLAVVVCAVVPLNVRSPQGAPDSSRELSLYTAYQTRMIARYGILEGAAFVNIVAAIMEQQAYSLAIVGLIALVMLAMFPTRGRLERFVKTQTELSQLPHGNEGP
jgi:hypothetical protein